HGQAVQIRAAGEHEMVTVSSTSLWRLGKWTWLTMASGKWQLPNSATRMLDTCRAESGTCGPGEDPLMMYLSTNLSRAGQPANMACRESSEIVTDASARCCRLGNWSC